MTSSPDGSPVPVQPRADRTYTVNAHGVTAMLVGEGTQIVYAYDRGTWTDGVAPPPLISVSGAIDSPYRGLSAFEERDAAFFFGREEAATEVLERMSRLLKGRGTLVVSGASGAGKSSLLRAGVLPRLRGAGLAGAPGAASWPCLVLTPGRAPLDELAVRVAMLTGTDAAAVRRGLEADPASFGLTARQAALAVPSAPGSEGDSPAAGGPTGEQRLLLVVDQFEQVFTQCANEQERRAFITALSAAAGQESGSVPAALIVLGVRADFEARCAGYPELVGAVQNRYLVTPMTGRQLRMAITGPARAVQSAVEDELAEVLLAEVRSREPEGTGAGVLPLLSHALDQAWRSRTAEILALADYERTGGIEKAVAVSAQRAYDRLTSAQQATARLVFIRLTAASADGVDTADRSTQTELTEGKSLSEAADVDAVLEAFAAERLLTLAADSVEISHEVLLTAWPLLRDTWLAETHADRITRTRLRATAAEWERHSRDPSYLYRGTLLQAADEAAGRAIADPVRNPPLGYADSDFLRTSNRARQRAARRRQSVIAGLIVLTVTASAVAVAAGQDAASAARQHAVALSRQLAAESTTAASLDQPVIARQLAVAAWAVSPTNQASAAMESLVTAQQQDALLPAAPVTDLDYVTGVESMAFSPDGSLLATGGDDGTARLWDAATRQPVRTLHVDSTPSDGLGRVNGVAFSPNGKLLAIGDGTSIVSLWDPASGRKLRSLQIPASNNNDGLIGSVTGVTFSPDGRLLASSYDDGQVWLWNPATGRPIRAIEADVKADEISTGYGVSDLIFSPDGKFLATTDGNGQTRLWSTASGQPVLTINSSSSGGAGDVEFSPDGKFLATANGDGTIQMWNLSTGHSALKLAVGSSGEGAAQVAFSPDGRLLAAADGSGSIRVWNRATGKVIFARPPSGEPGDIAFSPDSKLLADTNGDGTVQMLDTSTALPAGQFLQGTPADGANDVTFSPDGGIIAIADEDGTVRLWDRATGQLARTLHVTAKYGVSSVLFSPNGKILASFDDFNGGPTGMGFEGDGVGRLWNASTGRLIGTVGSNVQAEAFSPDGKILATGSQNENGAVHLWNTATGQLIRTLRPAVSGDVSDLKFSPNGQILASGNSDGTVQLWKTATGQLTRTLRINDYGINGPANDTFVAFNSNSKVTATAGQDVRQWNASTGQLIRVMSLGPTVDSDLLEFSPDGDTFVTDDTTNLDFLNTLTGRLISTPIGTGAEVLYLGEAFAPDSSIIAETEYEEPIQLWSPATGQAISGQFGMTTRGVGQGGGSAISAFSPDNSLLVESAGSGEVEIWNLAEFESPYATLCADVGAPTPATWAIYASGEKEPGICPPSERANA